MQAMCITARLANSIVVARPEDIALDGILSYEVLRKHFGSEFYLLPDPKEVLYFARLPVDMRGVPSSWIAEMQTGDVWFNRSQGIADESLWYWSCSSAQIEVKGRDIRYWNKQIAEDMTDFIDFEDKRGKIIIEQGRYKAYHMPMSKAITDKVTWYAYGDIDAVRDLLLPVVTIGKKRSQGQGHVLSWSVEPIEHDYSEWRDTELMRAIPAPLFSSVAATPLNMQHIAFRAPQWHHVNQAMCVTKAVRHA